MHTFVMRDWLYGVFACSTQAAGSVWPQSEYQSELEYFQVVSVAVAMFGYQSGI
jgi:hypothetical protein